MRKSGIVLLALLIALLLNTDVNANLVAWWPLDEIETSETGDIWKVSEATGNYADADVWGIVNLGVEAGPAGNSDRGAYFSSSRGIATNAALAIPAKGDFTVLVQMRAGGVTGYPMLLSYDNGTTGTSLIMLNSGVFYFWDRAIGTLTSGVNVGDWAYHELGVTRSGDVFSVLVDGVVKASLTAPDASISITDQLVIGCARRNANQYKGYIADVKIYNVAFADIKAPASSPLPRHNQNDVAFNPTLKWTPGRNPLNPSQINPNIKAHYLYGNFSDPNELSLIATLDASDNDYGNVIGEYLNLVADANYIWTVEEGLDDGSGAAYPAGSPNNISGVIWKFNTGSAPVVVSQPSNVVANIGDSAVLTIEVDSGSPAHYSWYKSLDNAIDTATDDTAVGSDSKTLTLSNIQVADEGYYFCVITNQSTIPTGEILPTYSNIATVGIKRQLAHWTLNNTTADYQNGQYIDVNIEDATLRNADVQGNPAFVTGMLGDAVSIDMSNGWANAGTWNPSEFTNQLTVSAWVKWNGSEIIGNGPGIVTKWDIGQNASTNYWSLYLSKGNSTHPGDAYIIFASWNGGEIWAGPNAVAVDEWVFVVATVDSERIAKVYVNGELAGVDTTWSYGPKKDAPIMIGQATPNIFPFPGAIDDVNIFNFALGEFDIAELYYGISGIKPCIQSYKPFADNNGDCEVNIVDFSMLADNWLNTGLYPDVLN